jgi:hypothetical protein
VNKSVRDLFASVFGQPSTNVQARGNSGFFTSLADAVRAARNTGKTKLQRRVLEAWTTPSFIRWRSNPNWPGRRAAAARRTSGKTRRMR